MPGPEAARGAPVATYKDHRIECAVHEHPRGRYRPRALIFPPGPGAPRRPKKLEWPTELATKAEAEALAVVLAKRAIDRGLVFR